MSDNATPVTITFRIPGQWSHPQELMEHLPAGYQLTPESLIMPDGTEIEFGVAPADGQFAQIFRSSCRQAPTPEELAKVGRYQVNVFLMGPGGTIDAARKMMQAASAIIQAGGAGVFIDNSTLAHGGQNWLAMTEDGGPDALSFAYVAIVRGKTDVWTIGMHTLGLRDIIMKRIDADRFDIIEMIRYLAAGDRPVDDGHIVADLDGPRFQCHVQDAPRDLAGSPMHNPFGRLKLVSMREIAEHN